MFFNFILSSQKPPRVFKFTHLNTPLPQQLDHAGLRMVKRLPCAWGWEHIYASAASVRPIRITVRLMESSTITLGPLVPTDSLSSTCSVAILAECSKTDRGYGWIECINQSRWSVFPTHVQLSASSPTSSISIYNPSSKNNVLIYVSQMDGVVPGTGRRLSQGIVGWNWEN